MKEKLSQDDLALSSKLKFEELQLYEKLLNLLEQQSPTVDRQLSQLYLRLLIDNSTAVQSEEEITVLRRQLLKRLSDLGTQTHLTEKGDVELVPNEVIRTG